MAGLQDISPIVSSRWVSSSVRAPRRADAAAAAAQARADHALNYPTVSAIGAVGLMPVRDRRLQDNYAAGGLVVNLPLFNGGRDTAKQRESELKARAAEELVMRLSKAAEYRDPETGAGFDAETLRDQVATLLLAGHETTALTLFWATMLLARAPDADLFESHCDGRHPVKIIRPV